MNLDTLSDFHFMRPLWLLGILALPIVWLTLRKFNFTGGDWNRSIDPLLLKHLTPNGSTNRDTKKNWPPIALIFLCLIALAGPSWERKPMPVAQLQDDTVVILDLSISMLATDVAPSRLVRAKQKIHDLLALRSEGNTSLVVFSGDSHVVTPLTDDINTITSSLNAIDPFIMPVIGSRPDLAIAQAVKLFEQNGSRSGRIILFSDGVTDNQISRISDTLSNQNISLNVIAVGTKEGAPINIPGKGYFKSQGEVVIPQTPLDLLSKLAKQNSGSMQSLSLDDSDLHSFDISGEKLRETKTRDTEEESDLRNFDTWIDSGYLILLILIPLALVAHRQNTLLIAILTVSFISYSEESYSFELPNLLKTNDQQAQKLMDNQSYTEAAEMFDSLEHKAAAHFRAGNFKEANNIYSKLETETSLYNYGNSLAKTQKLAEAIEAYNKVLELNPNHEDARFNKELIEQLQQQNQDNKQNSDQQDNNQQNNQQNKDQQNNNQDGSENSDQSQESQQNNQEGSDNASNDQDQQNSDSGNSETQNNKDNSSEQNQSNDANKNQAEGETKSAQSTDEDKNSNENSENPITATLQELGEEEKQSYEQWMRRVPDDPSGLLRRKFEQQSYERRRKGGADTLNEGEPVW